MSQLYLKYSSYEFILQKYFTSFEKANIFLKQDWAHMQCGEQAGSLAAPSMPAAKEMDRESTLPGRMCLHCGCVALAGQVRISPPGTGLWRGGCASPREKPSCWTTAPYPRLGSKFHLPQRPRSTFCL